MNSDHGLHFDDASGDLDEPQSQRVELSDAPLKWTLFVGPGGIEIKV